VTLDAFCGRSFLGALRELCPELARSAPGALHSAKLPALHTVAAVQGGPTAGVFSLADFFARGAGVGTAELAAAQRKVRPEDICYILYTSGSTAAPKGVTLAHGPLIANAFDIGERMHLTAATVVPIPETLDFVTAAAFPVAYGTSYFGLTHRGHLQSGETLLVLGAAGGVGLTAVEIGKTLGARVIAAAGGAEKLAVAKSRGADELIDYRSESIRNRVRELTGGKGADVVYDPVGGDAFEQALRAVNWEARMLVVGFASGRIQAVPANLILVKNISVIGVVWGAQTERDPAWMSRNLAELLRWWWQGKLKPLIAETFPLAEAGAALNALLSRRYAGKVVLQT
jgi:NADPH:quinone reductase